jgi:hypothetical protein
MNTLELQKELHNLLYIRALSSVSSKSSMLPRDPADLRTATVNKRHNEIRDPNPRTTLTTVQTLDLFTKK